MSSAGSTLRAVRRENFLGKLRSNKGYKRIAPILSVDADRLSRFEEACWRYYRAAAKHEFRGGRAKRALSHLNRLRGELGDPYWLEDSAAEGLEVLGRKLERLASGTKRGRPMNTPAISFFETMPRFIPWARAFKSKKNRSISQDEIDDVLSEIFQVVFGRRIAKESFTRMRLRYKIPK